MSSGWLSKLTFLDRQFVDEETAGSTIRASVASACFCFVLGMPMLSLAASSGDGFFVFLAFCLCGLPGLLAFGVWRKSEGTARPQSLRCFKAFNSVCICGLGCVFILTVIAQAVMVPLVQQQIDECCEECLEYCSELALGGGKLCPDEVRNAFADQGLDETYSPCFALQSPKDSLCTIGDVNVTADGSTRVIPACAEDFNGCVFPVACNPVASPCWATEEQNKLKAPGLTLNDEGEIREFGMGICRSAEDFRDTDLGQVWAVLYVITVAGCLSAAVSKREAGRLYSMDTCIMVTVPTPWESPNAEVAVAVPSNVQPPAMTIGSTQGALVPSYTNEAGLQKGDTGALGNQQVETNPQLTQDYSSSGLPSASLPQPEVSTLSLGNELSKQPSSARLFAKNNRSQVLLIGLCCINMVLIAAAGALVLPAMLGVSFF